MFQRSFCISFSFSEKPPCCLSSCLDLYTCAVSADTVNPTPSVVSDHFLSFLPEAILTLTIALSAEDKEVLAYFISCSTSANFSNSNRKTSSQKTAAASCSKSGTDDHPPCFSCNCFRCYVSYWVKWDLSPNRELIHEIVEAFEESLLKDSKKEKNKKERRKGKSVKPNISLELEEPIRPELSLTNEDFNFPESKEVETHVLAAAVAWIRMKMMWRRKNRRRGR